MKKLLLLIIIMPLLISCKLKHDMESINFEAPYYKSGLTFSHPRLSKNYDEDLIIDFHPIYGYDDGTYMVYTETDFISFNTDFEEIFEKSGINYNGISWSEVCKKMLSLKQEELLDNIKFDSEGGGFYAFADSKTNQLKIIKILSSCFNDKEQLRAILEQIETNEWGAVKESR